ncbi:MAG: pentapeptide repeat-containing protein [Nitrospinae bacterium]|nr:pentapeptide repeat-containing protein [Nitrospinota bacterium]
MMVRILAGDCSQDERLALAVTAQEVLTALQARQGVELDGVTLTGDLMLDRLPLEPVPDEDTLPAFVKERFDRESLTEVRVVKGPLILRDVEVQGILATNLLNGGYVIVQGPVSITGSTFQRSVDFSRTIFQGHVDFSGTKIGYEGFFIQAVFLKNATFTQTAFGTHSRFHKAVFAGKALFQEAVFHGIAEFLEVGFEKEADFSNARFVQGTGFSGSQFREVPNFSEATFERETYFRFSQFEKGANFRGGVFRKAADFTEATFGGESDFSRVVFEEPPQFTDEGLANQFRSLNGLQNPKNQAGLFVIAGLFLVFFYFLLRKKKSN